MCDYKNGKIYQLVCYETGEIYVGSTARDLEDRLDEHKSPSNTCYSKQIINRGNYYIELLETYPCNSQFELEVKESEYQRAIECINRRIARRTNAEWRQDNKETLKAYKLMYYKNNKSYISERSKPYRLENAEKIAKYNKEYHQNNKKAIKACNSKVVVCECGSSCVKQQLKRHKLTKKHINLMNKLNLS